MYPVESPSLLSFTILRVRSDRVRWLLTGRPILKGRLEVVLGSAEIAVEEDEQYWNQTKLMHKKIKNKNENKKK